MRPAAESSSALTPAAETTFSDVGAAAVLQMSCVWHVSGGCCMPARAWVVLFYLILFDWR